MRVSDACLLQNLNSYFTKANLSIAIVHYTYL